MIELVLKIVFWEDGLSGADKGAGGASDAVTFDIVGLSDHVGEPSRDLWLWVQCLGRHDPLGTDGRFDSLDRAHSRTSAATGAAVLAPLNDIGELLQRQLVVLV
jgi:hypothetical protein